MKSERKIGTILSYVYIIISVLIQLLYTPFLIKQLGQSEYGLYSLINSVIGYLSVLDLGFGNAIIVYTAKYRANNDIKSEQKLHGMFKVVFYIIGIIAVILGIILFLNINNIFGDTMTDSELYKSKIMALILTFNLGITFIFNIYSSIITAYEKFTFQKIFAIISSLLKPLLMTPLLFLGYKSISLTVVITFCNIFIVMSNYLFCKRKLKIKIKFDGFDKKLFKVIFGYSIWLFIGAIVDKINWSVDNFVLGAVSGTIAVSVYSVASQLNTLFINLSSAISGVLLPKISKMVAKNATSDELTEEFIKVGRIQYYIIFLMCSGLIIFGKQFIGVWVGKDFAESYYVALILIIPVCFPLIQNLGISIMQAMNKYKFRSISLLIMAIINIIISIFLSKTYGAIGAAIGTGLSLILCNVIIMNIYYYRVIKLDIAKFWKNIILMSLKLLIPVIFIYLILLLIRLNSLFTLIIFIPLYCLMYFFISYFFVMNDYEKSIILKVINKIRRVNGNNL